MRKKRMRNQLMMNPRCAAVFAALAALSFAACSDAESREDLEGDQFPDEISAEDRARAQVPAIPTGATLVFEVSETVSTDSHDEGDHFRLHLVSDVQGTNDARLSQGTEARGIVIAAEESTGPEDEAALVVAVQSVTVNGNDVELDAEVQSATMETSTADSGVRTAAKIATGAAAGAVVGQILGGDTRSTVGGAIAGGLAGAGVAITTRDGHAVLPEGSTVTVRLEEPLPMNR